MSGEVAPTAVAIEELRRHQRFAPLAMYELRVIREGLAGTGGARSALASQDCASVLIECLVAAASGGDLAYLTDTAETMAAVARTSGGGARALVAAGAVDACACLLRGPRRPPITSTWEMIQYKK